MAATMTTPTSRSASFSSRWQKAKANCAALWVFTNIAEVSMPRNCANFTSAHSDSASSARPLACQEF